MLTVKVIHTLQKPYERLYAGIYVQEPIDGVLDKNGQQLRALHDAVGIREVPNKIIASCIRRLFDRCPRVDIVEYKAPRGNYIILARTQSTESIYNSLTEGGSYVS